MRLAGAEHIMQAAFIRRTRRTAKCRPCRNGLPQIRCATRNPLLTPLAVPALIRSDWWPMTYFCIFKAPPAGVTHVFRKNEPFISFIVIPADPELELAPMEPQFAAQREMRARRLALSRDTLAEGTRWTSSTNTVFDGTYRKMARAARARARTAKSQDGD